jgi:cell division protein FtsB
MRHRALVASALGLVAAGLLVFGGAGLLRVRQMKQEVEVLEREIRLQREEADRRSREVDRLRDDPALIEQIAREELGLVKPGEQVLKFPPAKR